MLAARIALKKKATRPFTTATHSDQFEQAVQDNLKAFSKGTWFGRVATQKGFKVISVTQGVAHDLSAVGVWSTAFLLQNKDPLAAILQAKSKAPKLKESLELLIRNASNQTSAYLASPHDLSSMKACGVVYVGSLLDRIVEEQAAGIPHDNIRMRRELDEMVGPDIGKIRPNSPEALKLLRYLTKDKGVSKHYLEVALGPDSEVFSKSQPMSSVGFGAQIGIHPKSVWSNPEPELVLVINRFGTIVGCTLGNDVNLRDFEGRSALLLGKAKDNNGSCSIGPMVRLFDDKYTLADAEKTVIELYIDGRDGFSTTGKTDVSTISRSLSELKDQTFNDNHQYPDGAFLMTGTGFSPTDAGDRDAKGEGFTHKIGDLVAIKNPHLGTLINTVNHSDKIARWEFGICDLFRSIQS